MDMVDCATSRAAEQIAGIVGEIMARHGVSGPVSIQEDLASLGLTSIDMVELMLGIEAEFDLTIPPAEITIRNFSSIASIDAMLARLRPTH